VDRFGGDLVARTRFAVELIEETKRRAGPDFPVSLRFSQWKGQDYAARPLRSAQELERWLEPLAAAGVDIFHCSTRRYWLPEFEGSDLNLAGWTKKLTGKPTITVGSVGLDEEFIRRDRPAGLTGLDPLLERLERGEFDLVAVGRSLIANPDWAALVRRGAFDELRPYDTSFLESLA
jgi:2,4-dienoyl-CoA reductase-like NADH-dependent reductase (Old Yellow Enzyme family)